MSNDVIFGADIAYMSVNFKPLIDGSTFKGEDGKQQPSSGDTVTLIKFNPTKARTSAIGNMPYGMADLIDKQQNLAIRTGQEFKLWLNIRTTSGEEVSIPVEATNDELGDL
tara:strand:- start:490 stop:822 length:333 start_codon:yes stop_codon:yes gene_type:complete